MYAVLRTPGKTAIVVSFKSRREDNVLAKILERLKDDAKRQFTRQLPALICVHMADLSEKQLLDIAEVGKSTATGIRIVLTKLLHERPHIHTVALTTDGLVRVKQNGQSLHHFDARNRAIILSSES